MSDLPTVLVVDDKLNMLGLLVKVLSPVARIITAANVREAVAVLDRESVAAVVCDLRMPDGDGLEVLRSLKARSLGAPFILMTAYATVTTAVQAMREGAFDYITKPFDPDDLRALVERALAQSAVLSHTPGPSTQPEGMGLLLGRSSAMKEVFRLIERIAPTDATVLILGETGTGKELVARAIHERSPRASKPFYAVNCAAIARSLIESELFGYARGSFTGANTDRAGIFEAADKSTLLLDEIGELRASLQAKLTRVLEERAVKRLGESRERPIDVRLLGATHRNLREMVKSGTFREDLWFRLNVCIIELPPLRDRPDDIPFLANHFLAERAPIVRSAAVGFSPSAMSALASYSWPGNVRELRSVVERAAILSTESEIGHESLPTEIRGAPLSTPLPSGESDERIFDLSLREAVNVSRDKTSRQYVVGVLRRFHGEGRIEDESAGLLFHLSVAGPFTILARAAESQRGLPLDLGVFPVFFLKEPAHRFVELTGVFRRFGRLVQARRP